MLDPASGSLSPALLDIKLLMAKSDQEGNVRPRRRAALSDENRAVDLTQGAVGVR